MNKRDSFIFYRSFFEAISDLPDNEQLLIYKAISEFSLNFKEIELNGISATIFKLVKPQLEANNKRFINGNQPKNKQNKSKLEAKQKQNRSKYQANKNVNDNVNDNVNNNNNIPSLFDFVEYAKTKDSNVDVKSIEFKYQSWVENGWKDGNNNKIKNWKSKILNTLPYLKKREANSRYNEHGKPKLAI